MAETFDLVLQGGTCVTPSAIGEADVGVADGLIKSIGDLGRFRAVEVFDAAGLHILPGVIDTQVHFREPGLTEKEDIATGSAAAALGGVTAVFEMPNTKPPTISAAALADKCRRAKNRAWVDIAFYVGATAANVEHLNDLERLPGCAGVKIFMGGSTGGLLVADETTLAQVLANGCRRCAVHCEDEDRLRDRFKLVEGGAKVHRHPQWRDAKTALLATRRLLRLARGTKRRVHVLHVSTADEMALLGGHHDIATVEVTPQHLTLVAPETYDELGTLAQMNPPIREARHRDALWTAVDNGLVDCIGSDHAPHLKEDKDRPYPESPSGMPGVQTLVPVMLNHVHQGRLSLGRFVDLTSAGPARVFAISGKGRIAAGFDADFTVVDLKARRAITSMWIASRCGWTPFEGMDATGWPVATFVRGLQVMREGELLGEPRGSAVRFLECL
ncbi:MAG: dihydroorotase [Rhodospirillales bacterium]|jgi:dihydroorotase|nr:dihydroorotase [Rhodospirillales bacterium]MDP7216156.1 dihydroorotase [Rhodospirillales bacterium]HIJ43761.1 dihydroorotase [Rhodospirillaceae bacterium]HIJ93927.1 dihydroorotase [Rhodospirillaceae bacterium]HJO75099.1 dihydroorotase [Rhodospirillales bacterium]